MDIQPLQIDKKREREILQIFFVVLFLVLWKEDAKINSMFAYYMGTDLISGCERWGTYSCVL